MSNLLHSKASRTQILNHLPNKNFGKEGDIVISHIRGRGVYLCTKAGGSWFAANKMSELSRLDKTPLDIVAKKLKIKDIQNSKEDTDKFVVSTANGDINYRNSEQLLSDLNSDALAVDYKTAYCSLGQYGNKKDCETNGGTWYYSENDSHDSMGNVAENELLTVGSSIGKVDAESTLTYDGSTLEIKRNSDFDDNWQTSAQDTLLKLSYDSSNNVNIAADSSGNLTIDSPVEILSTSSQLKLTHNTADYATFTLADTGDLTIATVGDGSLDSTLTLDADGVVILDSASGYFNFFKDGDTDSYAQIRVAASGVTSLQTNHNGGTAGHLTLDVDGNIFLEPAGRNTRVEYNSTNYFNILMEANGATTMSTVDSDGAVGHLILDPDGDLLLQPATHTYSALPIGFTQDEPTFDDTDTIITFSTKGNKAKLTLTDNCTDIHFKFPAVSGNFVCVLLQDGTGGRTISNWKTQDSAGNAGAGNSGLVLWAGGTAPANTETANKADIASFYWDADNEIAYGTYTYNF